MNFRGKLLTGYLFLSLLFAAGILLCLKPLGPIERSIDRLAVENLPILTLIESIRIRGNLLHAEMLDISYLLTLESTPETRKAIEFEILESDQIRDQLLKDVQEYHQLVERYFPEESLYIPLLQVQVDQLILVDKELKKRAAGGEISLPLARRSQIKDLEKRFLEVTDQIIREEVRETRLRREQISEVVAQARFRIGGICILFLASTLPLIFLLGRRILRPVRSLAEATEDFLANRAVKPLATHHRDELGRLARAVHRMMVEIGKQQPSPVEGADPKDRTPHSTENITDPPKN